VLASTIGRRRNIHAGLDCLGISQFANVVEGLFLKISPNILLGFLFSPRQNLDNDSEYELYNNEFIFMARQPVQMHLWSYQSLTPLVRFRVISPEKAF
jgi:hypothetical protein